MGLDTTIFGKKTVSDVLKEIYDNSRTKEKQINALIGELKPLVENIGDATLVVPMIKEYLEVGVKNDEHLIKMVALVQRFDNGGGKDASDFFDPEELAKLMEQSQELGKDQLKKEEE
jgi:type I restriction-modification system DNA methylase subunit